jgi:hypothetical protein
MSRLLEEGSTMGVDSRMVEPALGIKGAETSHRIRPGIRAALEP